MPPNQWAHDRDAGAVVGLAVAGATAVGIATSGTKLATVAVEVVGSIIVDRADQAREERLFE